MASSSSTFVPLLLFLAGAAMILPQPAAGCYPSIFSFGDSLADTGNLLTSQTGSLVGKLPYGRTYFHRATGRFSDGRLIADFIAQAMRVPLLPPYLAGPTRGGGFKEGANFAVAGATALDSDFFRKNGLMVRWTNFTLSVQLEWFKQLLPSISSSESERRDILSKSLILMGEIGGNDYNHPFFQGRSLDEIKSFVPHVIKAIGSAINELIGFGARTLLVPGIFPNGCISSYLEKFQTSNSDDYDNDTGCINWLNEFARYHNRELLVELNRLRELHPNATIIYADYFEALMSIFRSPLKYGYKKLPLGACCGGGGRYNFNSSRLCGVSGCKVSNDPSRCVSWDGLHLTEAAYRIIATGLLSGKYTSPPMNRAFFLERNTGSPFGSILNLKLKKLSIRLFSKS